MVQANDVPDNSSSSPDGHLEQQSMDARRRGKTPTAGSWQSVGFNAVLGFFSTIYINIWRRCSTDCIFPPSKNLNVRKYMYTCTTTEKKLKL